MTKNKELAILPDDFRNLLYAIGWHNGTIRDVIDAIRIREPLEKLDLIKRDDIRHYLSTRKTIPEPTQGPWEEQK